jgi:hypothetical protein
MLVYGTSISRRSTDESGRLGGGDIAGLVIGVTGVLLTALTVFKGWQCWKLRRVSLRSQLTTLALIIAPFQNQANSGVTEDLLPQPTTAVTVNFNYYLTPSHLRPEIPASPLGQDIPLQPITLSYRSG